MTTGELTRQILIDAHELGMNTGEYSFFAVELLKTSAASNDFSWYKPGDRKNKIAREMYEALMVVAVRVPTSPEYTSYAHKVTKLATDEYGGLFTQDDVNPVLGAFYDCVIMYAHAYNNTMATGGDVRDGRSVVRRLWNSTFANGMIFDANLTHSLV